MIKSWIFAFFHALHETEERDRSAVEAHFNRHLALWQAAEEQDFHGIFFSEHHFGPAYSPSPNLLVAAMAMRTKRLRLGVLGVSTPYATPLRIVEEAAMLDNLTSGRLEIGVVQGVPQEWQRLKIAPAEGMAKFDQTLRAVDAALRSASAGFVCEDLPVSPPMLQENPPKWLAITSEASARRAAALGWKICSGFVSLDMLTALFDAYRDEAGLDRRDAADMLGIRRRVLFVESPSQTEEARAALRTSTIANTLEEARIASGGAVGGAMPSIDLEERLQGLLSTDEFVVGTPEQVAEQIIVQCRTAGCAHFLATLDSSDRFDTMAQMHEIYAAKVIPLLRKANLAFA